MGSAGLLFVSKVLDLNQFKQAHFMYPKKFRPQTNHKNESLVRSAIKALHEGDSATISRLGLGGYELSSLEPGVKELARRLGVSLRDVNLALRFQPHKSFEERVTHRSVSSSPF